MTARGKQVKLQTLTTEKEIFLYDRGILASSTSASKLLPAFDSSFTPFIPDDPPHGSVKSDTIPEWQKVFKQRREWAQRLYDGSHNTVEKILQLEEQINIIQHGVGIAVENIRQHVENLKPKYEETKAWADQTCKDQAYILARWRGSYDILASVVVEREFMKCLRCGERSIERADARFRDGDVTLQDLVDGSAMITAGPAGEKFAKQFKAGVNDLAITYKTVTNESKDVIDDFRHSASLSKSDICDQANHLLEEIEVLYRKISSDYEHITETRDGLGTTSQASKTAHLHRSNLVPSLVQTSEEIAQLLQQTVQRKQTVMRSSVQYLQQISLIESRISSTHSKLAALDVDADSAEAFDLLNVGLKLPSMFGVHLVEYVRRYEWTQKMLSEWTVSAEDMYPRREEEAKRRERWQEAAESLMKFGDLGEIGMEAASGPLVSHRMEPLANRDDVLAYIDRLRVAPTFQDALREVSEASNISLGLYKQPTKPSIAFKNGSLHGASYSKTSMTSHGEGQNLISLRNEKSRVDEKLKSAESRIRKLEDLLHRQSQLPRPSSANGFAHNHAPTFERHVTSPVPNFTSALSKAREVGSRRSSTSSRRVSQNLDPEEKGLAQRIVSLEAALIAQKAQSRDLEKNAAARQNAEENLKSQAREAIATKEDLLSNLEAQQHEFENERKLLEEDKGRLKLQVEDLEDELDRIHDSNVHNEEFYALQDQFERLKHDAYEREGALQNDLNVLRERFSSLEQISRQQNVRNTELESTASILAGRIKDQENAQASQYRALRSSLLHLAHDTSAPSDFHALVETLETVAERSADKQKELRSALETLRADSDALEARLRAQGDEIYDLREHLGSTERITFSLRDRLSTKETECMSLESQLKSLNETRDALQTQLKTLENEHETQQSQLMDRGHANERLTGQLVDLQGRNSELNDQIEKKDETVTSMQQRCGDMLAHLSAQASRADNVSKRLQLQNESLRRLLEQIGFMVTKQEEGMVIQKLPKSATSASTTFNDPSLSMKRSISGVVPGKTELEALIDSDALHWAMAENPQDSASRYDEFMNNVSAFDIEAFNEATYKRIKDVEHVARKWQREARSYRDKAHRAQSEAHERIALRSFKEGDLALFLPTRDQATKPWAAFNVGAPHYFLREQDSHKLGKRDWLIARISKVEERVVDLSRSINGPKAPGVSMDEENPYELSDGLRWYLLDAAEEKPGAPMIIGTGKATVALAETDKYIKGSIGLKKASDGSGATKTLTRSLDSRRSSTNSRKGLVAVAVNASSAPSGLEGTLRRSNSSTSARAADRSSIDLHDPSRPEPSRMQEISQKDDNQNDQVGPVKAPDW
ncbi:MAG: hypothetical protein Q9164_003900 [Protoblastenia rupestris]